MWTVGWMWIVWESFSLILNCHNVIKTWINSLDSILSFCLFYLKSLPYNPCLTPINLKWSSIKDGSLFNILWWMIISKLPEKQLKNKKEKQQEVTFFFFFSWLEKHDGIEIKCCFKEMEYFRNKFMN